MGKSPCGRSPEGQHHKFGKKKHFTRPLTVVCSFCPMVLGGIFLAQNNSVKLTITTSVFLFFQIFDIKNLVNASKNLATLVQFTLGKQNFPKLSQCFCQKTTKFVRKKKHPLEGLYIVCTLSFA